MTAFVDARKGPPVARLIGWVVTEILVDHGSFDLLDDRGDQGAYPDFASSEWVFVGDNEVVVCSPLSYHQATVTVEAWDAEPAPAAGWEDSRVSQLKLDSGVVGINPLVEGEDTEWIDVGGPGRYGVRVQVAGRDALVALGPDPEVEPVGVERYLVQFWHQPA
jgi:hypothetical protein